MKLTQEAELLSWSRDKLLARRHDLQETQQELYRQISILMDDRRIREALEQIDNLDPAEPGVRAHEDAFADLAFAKEEVGISPLEDKLRTISIELGRIDRIVGEVDNRLEFKLPFDPSIVTLSDAITATLVRHLQRFPSDLRILSPRKFEEFVAELWNGFGYEVELTRQTRDGGRDIIAVRKHLVAERYLIECKLKYRDGKVGVKPVRELYGVKTSEGATKAILATTAYFTRDAELFFTRHKWELEGKDFEGIMEWVEQYASNLRA